MVTTTQGTTAAVDVATTHAIYAAGAFKGAVVYNYAGQTLGKVDEFVLDFDSGRITYVVISLGGFLGLGDKLFAIPWELVAIRPDEHAFYADVEKQLLIDAPSFDRKNWPGMSDSAWAENIRAHYAQKPYWNSDITDAGDYVGDDLVDKPDRDRI
jgi:sporulation protein YlmC with PRC-barrel domain